MTTLADGGPPGVCLQAVASLYFLYGTLPILSDLICQLVVYLALRSQNNASSVT